MRRYVLSLAVLTLIFGLAAQAGATVISDNPAVGITQGAVDYPDFGGNDLPTVIVQKTFNNLNPITAAITYASSDLQGFGGGAFRWFERITNLSNIAWKDYHLTISGDTNAEFFIELCCGGLPSEVTSDYAGVVTEITLKENKPLISSDRKDLWFEFSNPIPHGGVLEIHVPIGSLNSGTSFVLAQHPSPVPEPGTLLLIGSGLVGIGVGARRRRRS